MILGDNECSKEIAYFLKHGVYPKQKKTCTQSDISCDFEHDKELYRGFQEANYTEYFDWARLYRFCLWR